MTRFILLCGALVPAALLAQQAGGRWEPVAHALGTGGNTAGETYRATFPRSDLRVRIGDVAVAPALALTSWAGFAGSADTADVMGDLVLTEREVPVVTRGLLGAGFDVTGIHHHLIGETPRVFYLHYHGRGPAVQLAARLREVLARTATPMGEPAAATRPARVTLDTAALFAALGAHGRLAGNVAQVSVPTSGSAVTLDGRALPAALGVNTAINLQGVTARRAVSTGDFVLTAARVQPTVRALEGSGIRVTAIHNHLIGESPAAYFVHFWGDGEPLALARELKAAIDSAR